MANKKKSRPAAKDSDPAGRNGAEQIINYPHCTTPAARRQQLQNYDATMAAADLAGDSDAWVDAFQAWLDVFTGGRQ
jgi:hypothetical protein